MKRNIIGDYSLYFYEKYQIADWNRKKLLLSDDEIHNLLKDLDEGIESELVKALKLPFPKFASQYLSKFSDPENITKTLGYEYTLFMLTESQIKAIVNSIKGYTTLAKAENDLTLKHYYSAISAIMAQSFNQFNPIINITLINWEVKAKYIYLLHFIDKTEAERLKLNNHTFFAMEQYRGFELNEKLELLNTSVKETVKAYIGIENFDLRMGGEEIAEFYSLPKQTVRTTIETILPLLLKSQAEMQNALGYLGKKDEQGANEYTKEDYRKLDIRMETSFIKYNKLTETEKKVLEGKSSKEVLLYLTAKYMFLNKDSLAKNMGLSIKEANERILKLNN